MSKKGSLFDFNGDGNVSMLEDFIAYTIHEGAMHGWRDTYEDGIEFDVDPDDYINALIAANSTCQPPQHPPRRFLQKKSKRITQSIPYAASLSPTPRIPITTEQRIPR